MSNNYLQTHEEQGNTSENVIDELIMKTYFDLFKENKLEKKLDNRIPSVKQVFNKADYDFDTGCYDVIYGIDKSSLTEEKIMLLLQNKGCVYRWGAFVCCDSQLEMFNEEELIDNNEGWYINASNK